MDDLTYTATPEPARSHCWERESIRSGSRTASQTCPLTINPFWGKEAKNQDSAWNPSALHTRRSSMIRQNYNLQPSRVAAAAFVLTFSLPLAKPKSNGQLVTQKIDDNVPSVTPSRGTSAPKSPH